MKPYANQGNLTREEVQFNNCLSATRVVVENAFGRLKGRFRCIGKRLDLCVGNSCSVTAACCALPNFREINEEEFELQWLNAIQLDNEALPENPNQRQDHNARMIRDSIKQFLSEWDV